MESARGSFASFQVHFAHRTSDRGSPSYMPVVGKRLSTIVSAGPRMGVLLSGWVSAGEHVLILSRCSWMVSAQLVSYWDLACAAPFSCLAPFSVSAGPGVLSLRNASGGGRSLFRTSLEITPLFCSLHLCVGLHLSF